MNVAWDIDGQSNNVVRGGYGIFFDRPSAAFINTIYSNYPFFKSGIVVFTSVREGLFIVRVTPQRPIS